MNDLLKHPKDYKSSSHASPVHHKPTMTNWWFIKSPYNDKYVPRGGNAIKLLNCGEAYLPELRDAIINAKESIYIAIWGFDDNLSLILPGLNEKPNPDNYISKILQDKAAAGVEVKILVWYNPTTNKVPVSAGGEPTLRGHIIGKAWCDRAIAGEIENLQFLTRNNPGVGSITENGKIKKKMLNDEDKYAEIKMADKSIEPEQYNILKVRREQIKAQTDLLDDGWDNVEAAQDQRFKSGMPTSTMGRVPTHHQKAILIDHGDPENANGFIQGFNLWPIYLDFASHPYRDRCWEDGCLKEKEPHTHRQDVGLHLHGPCLVDLFHNFKEGWNKAVEEFNAEKKATKEEQEEEDNDVLGLGVQNLNKENKKQQLEVPTLIDNKFVPTINSVNPKKGGRYYAQILRTWPLKQEQQVYKFIQNAIPRVNEFIYVEDQFFRMPEFAKLLNMRAETMKKNPIRNKLYLFVVTSLNQDAVGGSSVRKDMVHELGRDDVNADKKTFADTQSNQVELEKIKQGMEAKGVMVHICQLLAYKTFENTKNKQNKTYYKNIYVHAKISFYDNAYLLLGSANWNLRSMTQDSELDIAIESHDDLAMRFREKLWGEHLKGLWKNRNTNGMTKPADWYEQWWRKLSDNWGLFMLEAPLRMNLFPYFEDITNLNKKFWHPIDNEIQNSD